ncbi:MAG: protein kinase [Planctomycetota bacterium]
MSRDRADGGNALPSSEIRVDASASSVSGPRPVMSPVGESDSSTDPIVELANEYLERHRAGEAPDIEEYKRRYPDLARQIEDVFPMMLLMEDNAPSGQGEARGHDADLDRLGDFKIRRVIGRGGMGVVYEALQESLGRHVALKVCPATVQMSPRNSERFRRESRAAAMLHHTNIVPVFAVGEEDGRLFYAMQFIRGASLDEVIRELRKLWQSSPTATTRLSARSAELHSPSEASEVARSLFGRSSLNSASEDSGCETPERESAADEQLSLVPEMDRPHEVNLPGVMASSASSSSSSSIGKYWESVAKIGLQVANALAYAHAQGTLHRDIKPSNLMLDQAGIVWVMDFGLAKSTEEDDLTRDGELIGTLRYMSPEQCAGKPEPRSDVYSLGLTLYELLALQPAFKDLHRSQLVRAIADQDPVPPRKINPNVPKDLETIVLKSIEKEPAKRYASPTELERDLQRFLAGEPIQARAITSLERLHKWIRRRPLVSGLTAALATVFLVSFGLVAWSWLRAEKALVDAQVKTTVARSAQRIAGKNQVLAEERLELAESALYRGAVDRARMLSQTDAQTAGKLLQDLIPTPGQTDRRGWEWGYLQALVHQHVAAFDVPAPQAEWIWDLTFSADDSMIAVASGRPAFVHPKGVSPKGRATFWDTRTAEMLCELPIEHSGYDIAISHDNRLAAVSEAIARNHFETGWGGFVQVWDLQSKTVVAKLEMPDEQRVYRLRFSLDDRLILGTVWNRNRIQHSRTAAWEPATGKQVWSVPYVTLTELADTEDSTTIEAIEYYGRDESSERSYPVKARRIRLDVASGEISDAVETIPCSGFYSPKLGVIFDCFEGDLVQYSEGGQLQRRLRGGANHLINQKAYFQPVCSVHERRGIIATGSTDGSICIWDFNQDTPVRVLHGHPERIQSLAISHNGEWLVSGDWSGQVRIWRPDARPEYVRCNTPTTLSTTPTTEAIAFRWDGSGIAAYQEKRIEVYEAESGRLLKLHWIDGIEQVRSQREACFDGAGNYLAVVQTDKSIAIYDVETGDQILRTEPLNDSPKCVSVSGDGTVLAASCMATVEGTTSDVSVWKLEPASRTLELVHRKQFDRECLELALDSNGNRMLVGTRIRQPGGFSHSIGSIELASFEAQWMDLELKFDPMFPIERTGVTAITFNRDATRFAFVTADGQGGIFEADEDEELQTWVRSAAIDAPANIEQLHWHPDGNRLAGANRDEVTVWNLLGEEVLKLSGGPRPHDYPFDGCVQFSPDGRKLAANRFDNNVSVWSTLRYPDQLTNRKRRLRAEERAKESIDKAIEQSPLDPWYLSVRGRIAADVRPSDETLQDYLNAKRMLSAEPCLFLNGDAHVVAPNIPFHQFSQYTIEAWVQRWSQSLSEHESPVACQLRAVPSRRYQDRIAAGGQMRAGIRLPAPRLTQPHQWAHIAICNDGETEYHFIDGRLIDKRKRKLSDNTPPDQPPIGSPFFIGDSVYGNEMLPKGEGLLKSLRVSSAALYTSDFIPPDNLSNHDECQLLFDFGMDQAETESRIEDRSGNERHGELVRAWWIPKE